MNRSEATHTDTQASETPPRFRLKVAQFGLGPIGLETARLAASRAWAEIIGAIDNDPEKAGKDLGQLTQAGLSNVRVHRSLEELLAVGKPDLIFHTTVSRFKPAFEQLAPIAQQGISVVSSCEELLFPQLREPALATELDAICRQTGARVIGTGVNPGFVMDLLPVCLTGVSREVRAIHVQRVVDASTRRGPLQKKIGSGLAGDEFRRLLQNGQAGHAGLKESLALIAHSLGWPITDLTETGEPIIAQQEIRTDHVMVKRGQVCGLHQRAEAQLKGRTCLTLDLQMYLEAKQPHDTIQIEGEPPLTVVIQGGVAGDPATVAALVNTAPRLLLTSPGLHLATELCVPHIAC